MTLKVQHVPAFCISLFVCLVGDATTGKSDEVNFGREVRPILAKHCFKCHGPDPDTREAGLRLDQEEGATSDLGGYAAIVPGELDASELFQRVISEDDDLRMPPSDSGPALGDAEVDVLRRWIREGGRYREHWAFVAPTRPAIPNVENEAWCRQRLDRFVMERLEDKGLSPAGPAARESLIRRLYLDLTGTSPSPAEVDRFIHDDHPTAKRRLIGRLLASPAYAERFARSWLDLARYSDTNGYEKDRPRSIWPYRDWVIQAIGNDMPFDQFSIEQLAGDMLADANQSQRIATGFHRNTMLNEEGGIDPLEYRFYALVDRVATTGTVWMGITTGCAQCHTHKYDPVTHQDYYALMALINGADEPDIVVEDPQTDRLASDVNSQVDGYAAALAQEWLPNHEQFVAGEIPDNDESRAFSEWFAKRIDEAVDWYTIRPSSLQSTMPKLTVLDDDSILASGDVTKRDVYQLEFQLTNDDVGARALRLEVLPHVSLPDGGPGMAYYEGRRGDFFLSELQVRLDGQPVALRNASHSYGKISVGSGSADASNVTDSEGSTGWSTSGAEGEANQLVVNFESPIEKPGSLKIELLFERHFAAALGRFRLSLSRDEKNAVASSLPVTWQSWLLGLERASLAEKEFAKLQRAFVLDGEAMAKHRGEIDLARKRIPDRTRTLGMKERPTEDQRVTFRHHRGEYLQPREEVRPGVPVVFHVGGDAAVTNRLELARWLMSDSNPLVGRVTANRAWREFFGVGIVNTAGDFGTQSEPPTHRNLIDFLAIDLADHQWSMKHLHRQIALSATYGQQIGAPPAIDPANRLLSVFPARRLSAEQIRDSFLSAAGLLAERIGGPSVYPPQPASVMQMAYGKPRWSTSKGADRFRRSIYTFSKRTAPFAAYATFDGPTGETCLARRSRSTTPLQALTLLNDAMYLEIADGLANQAKRDLGEAASDKEIARQIFRRLLIREPDERELAEITSFANSLEQGQDRWMLVARALMNTDEAISVP